MKYAHSLVSEYLSDPPSPDAALAHLQALGLNPAVARRSADDLLFELEIPANRGDLLSLVGVARELLPLAGGVLREPETAVEEEGGETFPVEIEDPDGCPYYSCRIVRGVRAAESDADLRRRMEKLAFRSGGAIVDLSNLVMAEIGQPLHVFDLDRLAGRIVVRRARRGERIRTIDGRERELDPEVLVIADDRGPVAVAGVMGSADTEVGPETRSILIESALFNPRRVRRGSKALGLQSEASVRFEKGIDGRTVRAGLARLARLVRTAAGGRVGPVSEAGRADEAGAEVVLAPDRVGAVLGIPVPAAFVEKLFSTRGFSIRRRGEEWTVSVPSFRGDVREDVDLIEEIARYRSYDEIPVTVPAASIAATPSDPAVGRTERLRDALVSFGFTETVSSSFIAEETAALPGLEAPAVANALSLAMSRLRPHLLPGMLETVRFNVSRRQDRLRIFEVGTVFRPGPEGPAEVLMLSMLSLNEGDFFAAKGDAEAVLDRCGIAPVAWVPVEHPLAEGGALELRWRDRPAGLLFRPSERVLGHFEIAGQRIVAAGIDIGALSTDLFPVRRFAEPPRFPASRRDLSFVIPGDVPWPRIEEVVGPGAGLVEKLELADIYRGGDLPPGRISLCMSLVFRKADGTLTGQEIEERTAAVVAAMKREFDADLRA